MDRGLKAAFLFSVLVVAQADRALTAHKPSGGALHAVAVLRSTVVTGAATSQLIENTFSAVGNYMITNGNGTWTYSYYANNGNLNNNDAGMGDYTFSNQNPTWFNANAAVGPNTGATLAAGNTIAALYVPSFDNALTQVESPVSRFTVGINSATFTGAKTGVAVGVFGGFADYDQLTYSATSLITQIGTLATGTGATQSVPKLNILLTFDGATTWVRASGLPALGLTSTGTLVAAVAGTNFASLTANVVAGTAGTATTIPPYPTLTVGDLTAVKMASKTLGWAVGGNDVQLAVAVSSNSGLGVGASFANAATATLTGGVALGMVLMTQNGGTVWKNVPIFVPYSTLLPLWKNNDPSLKSLFSVPIPGILFSVDADAAGKHVYAVGSGPSFYSKLAASLTYLTDNSAAAAGVQVKPYGTILYSGNAGMSWVQQTAPTLYSGASPYALYDVAVQKGTTAVAVGGSPHVKFGAIAAGTIIYTGNGGFSWTQAVYPSSTGSKAPVFTSVAFQPSMSGSAVQQVWVGGYTTRIDADLTISAGTAPLTAAAYTLKAADFFPVAAVTGFTVGTGPTTVSSGVPAAKGQIYTILISKDGGKTFAAAPTSGLPTGFVVTSFTAPSSLQTDRSVYGITWDNAMHGWIFGYGFIISTQNGGVTWTYETPTDVGVTTVTPKVSTLASVPTTY